MASTQCMTNQAKRDFLEGIHQPSDTYKLALFTGAASLSKNTTAYSTGLGNEVSGTGYTQGGIVLTGPYVVGLSGDIAYIDFPVDPAWTGATISGIEAALLYNASSGKGNKAIAVFTWTPATSVISGSFVAQFPPTSPASGALIRIT